MSLNSDSTLETSKPKTFSEPQKILGWHFSEDTKLGFNDNQPIIIGETLSVEGEIIPCEFGLHASEKAFDAFRYVHGKYLWRVELEEDLKSHANANGIVDKWVGRKRKVLAGGDATEMLQKFGRDCALEVIHLLFEAPKEIKTFLKTGVITEIVKNYYKYYSYAYVTAYSAYNDTYKTDYYVYRTIHYVYSAHLACKRYDAYNVYNTISFAAKALNVDIKTYTSKFEKACLNFIAEKS